MKSDKCPQAMSLESVPLSNCHGKHNVVMTDRNDGMSLQQH